MLKNMVAEATNAPGTATVINLAGALPGRMTWRGAGFANGQQAFYFLEDGSAWECGVGTLMHGAPDTFSRDTVFQNSAGTTSRINFTGTTRIYNEVPAQRMLWKDAAGALDIESRLVSSLFWAGTSTGTGSAYVVTMPKPVSAYAGGFELRFRAHADSAAGATLNAGQGAKPIKRPSTYGNLPIQQNEIRAGHLVHVIYDPTGDEFVLLSAPPGGLAVPVGTWLHGGWDTLPPGCLWPDGRNVSRTTYAALFSVYGTRWGAGDGSTTFTLPDLRGRAVFGRDNMGGTAANRITVGASGIAGTTLGAYGGSEHLHAHAHGINDPTHSHGVNDPGHSHSVNPNQVANFVGVGGFIVSAANFPGSANLYSATTTVSNSNTGISLSGAATGITIQASGAGGSQNMPPAIIGNIVIYAGA